MLVMTASQRVKDKQLARLMVMAQFSPQFKFCYVVSVC